ncbi:MAG: NADPH-dependent 7-cyano-7-deazaguanine reductase QueF [Omnitrophica WOR_2 bacterium RIFCSPLOWO2_12_FULL_51_8]|nr:MAG: NADPH-dependent 7-cyano-7-deazaguanine reductase QueF [Omnitrophica WOR_2 bacterium RIFCSPLOWO2_12_FULL_51_8]
MKDRHAPANRRRLSYEGLQEEVRRIQTPEIEVWENEYPDKIYTVNLELPEFTCICPKTGLPDFAVINIEYSPRKYCVELKSFKMYAIFFRGIGIFHEHLVNKMLDDFVAACRPRWAKIKAVFNSRGGIVTTVSRDYGR